MKNLGAIAICAAFSFTMHNNISEARNVCKVFSKACSAPIKLPSKVLRTPGVFIKKNPSIAPVGSKIFASRSSFPLSNASKFKSVSSEKVGGLWHNFPRTKQQAVAWQEIVAKPSSGGQIISSNRIQDTRFKNGGCEKRGKVIHHGNGARSEFHWMFQPKSGIFADLNVMSLSSNK